MYSGGRFSRTCLKDIKKAPLRFKVKVEIKVGLDHQATVPDVSNEPYEADDLSEAVDDLHWSRGRSWIHHDQSPATRKVTVVILIV